MTGMKPEKPAATAGTPRPWTFWCRGRSPGSQVIVDPGLPGACAPVTSVGINSLLTVAGAAPDSRAFARYTGFPLSHQLLMSGGP